MLCCYDVFNLIVNGFTAVGTIGAVIISLWLSNRKIKDSLSFDLPDEKEESLLLSITNIGERETIIKEAYFKYKNKKINMRLCNSFEDLTYKGIHIFPNNTIVINFREKVGLLLSENLEDSKPNSKFNKLFIKTARNKIKIKLKKTYYIYYKE